MTTMQSNTVCQETPMPITAQEARALRNADTICFDHLADGTGRIRAIRRGENSPSGFEETVSISLDSSVRNYGADEGPWTGYVHLFHPKTDGRAQTIIRRLRAGSEARLVWTRDNASPITRDAGVVVDALDVKIQAGKVCDTIRVQTAITLDNSARMIRVAGSAW